MSLETATYIEDLVATNPVGATDFVSQGDDHLRLLKTVLKAQFPSLGAGAVSYTAAQLNDTARKADAQTIAGLWTFSTAPAFPAAGIADAALSSNVPLKNAANTFARAGGGIQTFQNTTTGADTRWRVTNTTGTVDFAVGNAEGYVQTVGAIPLNFYIDSTLRGSISVAGNWTINAPGSGTAFSATGFAGSFAAILTGAASAGNSYGLLIRGGTGATDLPLLIENQVSSATYFRVFGDGGVALGVPTGGNKGTGALNTAGAIYQNNVPVALAPLISVGAALDIAALAVGQSAYIYKSANTARTSNASLTIDPVLQFTNAPAGTYATEGNLSVSNADSTADFQVSWPRGIDDSGMMSMAGYDNAATAFEDALPFRSGAQEHSISSAGSSSMAISIRGIEVATAGQTLGPLWAQATSNPNATTMRAGSWLKVTRLA